MWHICHVGYRSDISNYPSSKACGSLDMVLSYEILALSAVVGLISIYISALIPQKILQEKYLLSIATISSRVSRTKEKVKGGNKLAKEIREYKWINGFKNIM